MLYIYNSVFRLAQPFNFFSFLKTDIFSYLFRHRLHDDASVMSPRAPKLGAKVNYGVQAQHFRKIVSGSFCFEAQNGL